MDKEISRYLLQLRRKHPYFATLSLFARYVFTERVELFESDGELIKIQPAYYRQLPESERLGLILHLTLHSALLHSKRMGLRQAEIWNIAADIVVNNLIIEAGIDPPSDTVIDASYTADSVEYVYEELLSTVQQSEIMQKQLADYEQDIAKENEKQNQESQTGKNLVSDHSSQNKVHCTQRLQRVLTFQESSAGQADKNKELSGNEKHSGKQEDAGNSAQKNNRGQNVPAKQGLDKQGLDKQGLDKSHRHAGQNQPSTLKHSGERPNDLDPQQKSKALAKLFGKMYPGHRDLKSIRDASDTAQKQHNIERHWRAAFREAELAARLAEKWQGDMPAGLQREVDQVMNPELNWQHMLWNFVVRTPSDFQGFDRRFVYRGLYIDYLESERLKVVVAVDTSGSIYQDELTQFISELQAIRGAYHFIEIELYYVDADIYGPFDVESENVVPYGGGGTDFSVFFEKVIATKDENELDLVVYFTDGYGNFPVKKPETETLWVVVPTGLESKEFPFGLVTRLMQSTY